MTKVKRARREALPIGDQFKWRCGVCGTMWVAQDKDLGLDTSQCPHAKCHAELEAAEAKLTEKEKDAAENDAFASRRIADLEAKLAALRADYRERYDENAELKAKLAETERERWFPLQSEGRHTGYEKPQFIRIPWFVAERAYAVYRARYGSGQSLERLAERGGFGNAEMDEFYPAWREAADENARLRTAVAAAEAREKVLRGPLSKIAEAVGKRPALHWDHAFGVISGTVYDPEALARALDPKALRSILVAGDRCQCGKYDLSVYENGRREAGDAGWHRRDGCPAVLAAEKSPGAHSPLLVTCDMYRHGASVGLVHVQTNECMHPQPAKAPR